jgi:hypothetical protein
MGLGGGGQRQEQLQIDPAMQQQLLAQQQQAQSQVAALRPVAEQAAQRIQTNFAPVQLPQFQDPRAQALDPLSRALVSQGQQQLAGQASAQQRGIAQQFRQQPGVANVLQRMVASQSALQQNPLLFQAGREQTAQGFQGQEFMQRQALAQAQANAAQQQLANQAVSQQLALRAAPVSAEQNLLSALSGLASLTGTRVAKEGK